MTLPADKKQPAKSAPFWVRLIRRVLTRVIVELVVLKSRLFGPPRVLLSGSPVNVGVLRRLGAQIGRGVRVHAPIVLHAGENGYRNLTIGDGCILNGNNYLDLSGRIVLEKGVSLGPGVVINTHNRFNYNEFLESVLASECGVRDVVIKEGTGIKANALIVMGVTIGKHSVVAGGAVVNRDIPDFSFAAGVPAVVKRSLR
jgi:acetyltransferase-like isoleucine patch superfamily enzyme